MIKSRIIVAGSSNPRLTQLRTMLEADGHHVFATGNPAQIIQETTGGLHDVLILDASVEGVCEYDLCRTIRPRSDLGIILLIRDNDGQAKIEALEAGADDYLPAPFAPAEFLARVRALLRRVTHTGTRKPKLVLSDRLVDLQSHQVIGPSGRIAHLTPKEFNVLHYLMAHANKPVSHQMLSNAVWQRDGCGDFEYLRVVIGQLRRKLEANPENPRHIVTDRASGYRFQTHIRERDAASEVIQTHSQYALLRARNDSPAMVQ